MEVFVRNISIVFIFLFCILSAGHCFAEKDKGEVQENEFVYFTPDYHITGIWPQSWIRNVEEENKRRILYINAPDNLSFLTVLTAKNRGNKRTLFEILKDIIDFSPMNMLDVIKRDEKRMKITGCDDYCGVIFYQKMEFSDERKDVLMNYCYLFQKGESIYIINLNTFKSSYNQIKKDVEYILDNLRFMH